METQRKITEIYHNENGTPGYCMMCDLYLRDIILTTVYCHLQIHQRIRTSFCDTKEKANYRKGNVNEG